MSDENDGANAVRGGELRALIERLERLQGEKKILADDEKVVFAEAKAAGYTPKYIRALIKLRKLSPSEREENDAMMELYMASLGMTREAPLFRSVEGMGVDVAVREKVIEALKLLAPTDGEIIVKAGSGPRVRIWRDEDGVNVEDVKDAPPPPPSASAPAPSPDRPSRPGDNAPNCTEDEAFSLGRVARRSDQPIIANPFAWNDARRRRWDEGWRAEDGGDGMGPK